MFKTHHPKAKLDRIKHETIDKAIARGVKIEKVARRTSDTSRSKSTVSKVIDKTLIPVELLHLIK
jgi:hypothetical protein